jgi:putrescine oxidase
MLEIGGQWVSPDQDALTAMLAELGLETYSRYRDGDNVYIDRGGALTRFEGEIFPVAQATEREIVTLIEKIDSLVAEIDPDRPWAHPRASCSDMAGKGYQHVDGAIRVGHETAAAIVAAAGSTD